MRVMHRLPDVRPSTGCTEPAAVALAAALAARAAGGSLRRVTVRCDRGTYQNGLLAGVPGCGGRAGLDLAAALGAVAGDPGRALEVLTVFGPADLAAALGLVAREGVAIDRREDAPGLWIDARVESDRGIGEARLAGDHLAVERLLRDGAPLPRPGWSTHRAKTSAPRPATLADALDLADSLDADDEAALLAGLATNVAAAGGMGGPPLDAAEAAGALAEAASRARMTGARVTVTTSGWSGNQGLVATLPLHALGVRAAPRDLARALATSHLVGQLLREGSPSPLCHALLAASAGAAAGCARLLGGGVAEAERACHLVVASAGAPACDGAKPACALRAGLAAAQAVRCARRALDGPVDVAGGLVGETLEETARRVAASARPSACHALAPAV
jgi:L-cysteine desulfidase